MSEMSPRLPSCRVCGSQMQEVAYIPPFAGKPGLLAYECPKCHAVTSDLEDLTKRTDAGEEPPSS